MASNAGKSRGWATVGQAAKSLAAQDAVARTATDRARTEGSSIPVDQVIPRQTDTRQLDPMHVVDLVESIAAIGLLEPLVLDRKHRLLAGGHRLAAVRLLTESDVTRRAKNWATLAQLAWAQDDNAPLPSWAAEAIERLKAAPASDDHAVPVRIVDIDSERDPARALAIEVGENEKRRDYTRAEVVAIAERLKSAGFKASRGKPKAGQRALGPALAVIFGKSERHVRRILSGDAAESAPAADPIPTALRRIRSSIATLQTSVAGPQKRRLSTVLAAAERLASAIDELSAN